MSNNRAKEMAQRHRDAKRPKEKASITLDAETLRLAEKWRVGNLKDTIASFAQVADEALTAVKAEEGEKLSGAGGDMAEEQETLGDHH